MRVLLACALIPTLASCGAAAPRKAAYAPYASTPAGRSYQSEAVTVSSAAPGAEADAEYSGDEVAQAETGGAPPPPPRSEVNEQQVKEMLVVEGWVRIVVEDVRDTAADIVREVNAQGGRIVVEDLGGAPESWYGNLKVRVPPDKVRGFLEFLDKTGTIEGRRIQATDVSREYFDREIALTNLKITMDRLQALAARESNDLKNLLEIEREMTRVRGDIERLEGEQRFLRDRVSWATIDINLQRKRGAVFGPNAKFHPGPRFSVLSLADPEGRERTTFGVGATLHFARAFTLDLDFYPRQGNEDRSILISVGGAAYSDFLGGGRRTFLNPYLGLRVGYANLFGESAFLVGGEVGVELFKHKWVLVDVAGRALGLFGERSDAALQGVLEVMVPF